MSDEDDIGKELEASERSVVEASELLREQTLVRADAGTAEIAQGTMAKLARGQASIIVSATEKRSAVTVAKFSLGEIPPPEMLGEYEHQMPGLGREWVLQWKANLEHRRKIESDRAAAEAKRMEDEAKDRAKQTALDSRRVTIAGVVGASGVATGGLLVALGVAMPAAGAVIAGSIGLAGWFLRSSRSRK